MNKKWWYFAKRNFKEIIRDPLSLVFNFVFPLAMFLLFQCFTTGKTHEEIMMQMPMFEVHRIAVAVTIFGFSFVTLFGGMLVSKDCSSSFINRLKISPLKSIDFIIGYALPMIAICLFQNILIYLIAWPFGFNLLNGWTLLSIIINLIISLFFVLIGLIIGSLVSDKAVGGMTSILINLAALLGCMFMPFFAMGKVYQTICLIFPFIHFITISNAFIENFNQNGNYILHYPSSSEEYYQSDVFPLYLSVVIILIYLLIVFILTMTVFKKKIKS